MRKFIQDKEGKFAPLFWKRQKLHETVFMILNWWLHNNIHNLHLSNKQNQLSSLPRPHALSHWHTINQWQQQHQVTWPSVIMVLQTLYILSDEINHTEQLGLSAYERVKQLTPVKQRVPKRCEWNIKKSCYQH